MDVLFGSLALATAAAFTGAALYINVAEHPARMRLEPRAQLLQWKPSYASATKMQASLAVASTLLGLAAWWATGRWPWIIGAIAMAAIPVFTLKVIMPTNNILKGTPEESAGDATRTLLDRWVRLHAVRSMLGLVAIAADIWAAGLGVSV